MCEKSKIIYPMGMLSEIVGGEEKVNSESERFVFNKDEGFFHYEEGKVLESLDESLADFAEKEMGYERYAATA